MGLFGDLDFDEVNTDLNPPAGVYECLVTKAEVGPTRKGDKVGLGITYTIQDEGNWAGNTIFEWKEVVEDSSSKAATYLTIRLNSLGLSNEDLKAINKITPAEKARKALQDAIVGKEVVVDVTRGGENGEYVNVQRVAVR